MKITDPRQDLSQALVLSWAAISSKKQDRFSVEDQLKLERAWCKQHGATLVDELVVRGFSRDYWTLADVVAAAAKDPQMEAFAKLQQHIRRKSFSVFLCYDADRFGRTESLILEVIGRITRDCNALIYTLFDGVWMDAETAPTIGLLKAHKAQQDVARLVNYRATGMDNRAQTGKSTAAVVPFFHRRVRDDKGKEIAVEVNEDLRPLWTDLATVILTGVGWENVEHILFDEYGHGKNGKPYNPYTFWRQVNHYAFWGHAALNYKQKDESYTMRVGPWIWDATIPPPAPTVVYRNRLPAVYGGIWEELGDKIKAELWRRYGIRGKANSMFTFRFHGMFICDECGLTMSKAKGVRHNYVACKTRYNQKRRLPNAQCTQTKQLREDRIEAFFTEQLQYQLDQQPSLLFGSINDNQPIDQQVAELERTQKRLQKRLDAFVDELGDAHEDARPTFRRKIAETSEELKRAGESIEALYGQQQMTSALYAAQENLIDELRSNGVAWLWQQPDTVVHQRLSVALGHNQLMVREGQIIGVIPASSHHIRDRRKRSHA